MSQADSAQQAATCPVISFDPTGGRKQAGEWMSVHDDLRAQFPFFRSDFGPVGGFYVSLTRELSMEILRDPETFSSTAVSVFDPDPAYKWIPEMLDPPEHTGWRRALAPLFAPKQMERLEDKVRARAIELIDGFKDKGSCNFVDEFSSRFPTTIFLELMGLPVEELDRFLEWEAGILHQDGTSENAEAETAQAMGEVLGYFAGVIEERRANPKDDIVSQALEFKINGAPPTLDDLLAFCLLMFMAGLDTVTQSLNYSMVHFARTPSDRDQIVADPALIPGAIEEVLRYYSIVVPARKATKDTEISGCPIKQGEMISVPLSSANRDEAAHPDAMAFVLDRTPNNHIGFGAGPHRCLGSHLARREMRIALEEWHARIPTYRMAVGQPAPLEHGGMYGLDEVRLEWDIRG